MPGPAEPEPNQSCTDDLLARVAALSQDRKVELLTGRTPWKLFAAPEVGLRELVVSDGPTGIRGTEEDPGERSISLPCPSAVAATWDVDLARGCGSVHGAEANNHAVDVILAPVVNLQRTPVGGRHFECQSEDPLLSGAIAGAIIDGIQAEGVGVCVKHFIGNESETLRTQYLARIDERTLREVYLAPFERAVMDSHAWSLMASYNRLDDGTEVAPAVAHHHLLTQLLKDEWGYDGLVISDWTAARTTVETAVAGLDLVMPGPAGPWSNGQLLAAVESGLVGAELIDDKVLRILRLASRVGGLSGYPAPVPANAVADADGFLRELAARAIVVLADDAAALPVADPTRVSSVVVIGPNAVDTYVQGGGSALVKPVVVHGAQEAFAAAFPNAEVTVVQGTSVRVTPTLAEVSRLTDPVTGEQGLHVEALDDAGSVLQTLTTGDVDIFWKAKLPAGTTRVRLSTDILLVEAGVHQVGLGAPAAFSLAVNGELVATDSKQLTGGEVYLRSLHHNAPFHTAAVSGPGTAHLEAVVQYFDDKEWGAFFCAVIHHVLPGPSAAAEIAEAVARAKEAELVVLIVGTNAQVESEGWDRADIELPGCQNELVDAVLAARPDAIVAVNAGAPVLLPWLDRARTVLWAWFPGQEGARGIAGVIAGRTEPAGRLPWTLPASYADVPVPNAIPTGDDLLLDYAEGIDVGYRGWLRSGVEPARPFGFGLGWTTWDYGAGRIAGETAGAVQIEVAVRNAGPRAGHETVQLYLEGPSVGPRRPVRWLAGFTGVDVEPGQAVTAKVTIARRAFETWDVATHGWVTPPGSYRIVVAHDLHDQRGCIHIER